MTSDYDETEPYYYQKTRQGMKVTVPAYEIIVILIK